MSVRLARTFSTTPCGLTYYRRFLSYKIYLWTKISSVATLKPHRDRGGAGSEYFDARLALASRHLRVKDFPYRGSKKMTWQRDCESFSNFQCCVLEILLEPQSVWHLKLFLGCMGGPGTCTSIPYFFSEPAFIKKSISGDWDCCVLVPGSSTRLWSWKTRLFIFVDMHV
jgi:hypothetical protein